MRGFIVLVIIAIMAVGGCSGSGDDGNPLECDFDYEAFINQSWSCVLSDDGVPFILEFYDDGNGSSDNEMGIFTWERTGCDTLSFEGTGGTGDIFNLYLYFVPINDAPAKVLEAEIVSSNPELDGNRLMCFGRRQG